jgi:hypothetical protein
LPSFDAVAGRLAAFLKGFAAVVAAMATPDRLAAE